MRKLLFNILAISILILSLASCNKDDNEALPDYTDLPCGSLSMTYDGDPWTSTSVEGFMALNAISVSANGPIDWIQYLLSNIDEGTYSLGGSIMQTPSLTIVDPADPGNYTTVNPNASGELIIEENDADNKTISGRFHATLIGPNGDPKSITEGLFNKLPYDQ